MADRMDVPDNANTGCPGTHSDAAGKSSSCSGCPNQAACASGAARQPDPAVTVVAERMSTVKHKILVLSGKGGVGKSTFSAQLAFSLAHKGYQVGLLDVDICGPSIPRMLGLVGEEVHHSGSGWSPVYVDDNLGVMSIGFMLPSSDDAVIWRGPRKNGLIKQFLTDVDWGALDFLIVDTPPGTSDEHISMAQYLRGSNLDGAVIVTTPQEVAMMDVRKEINFCVKTGIPVLGVVENMSGLRMPLPAMRFMDEAGADVTDDALATLQRVCPDVLRLSVFTDVFPAYEGGPRAMAERFGVPFLGSIPLDPALLRACEEGVAYAAKGAGPAVAPFREVVERIEAAALKKAAASGAGGSVASSGVATAE